MRLLIRLFSIFALVVVPIEACNPLINPEPSVSMTVRVAETHREGEEVDHTKLEGAEICLTHTNECELSDSSGNAILELPVDEEISYTVTKDGYEARLRVDVTDESFAARPLFNMWNDELTADWYDTLMSSYPFTNEGSVFIRVMPRSADGVRAGVTFDLKRASAPRFYMIDEFTGNVDAEATTEFGTGGFVEVPPGEYEIEIGGTASACAPGLAWPSDKENRIRFPVRAGYETELTVVCDIAP
jgi:hypothetical protein